jgi:hypothetical protein
MSDLPACAREGGAREDEGSETRAAAKHAVVGRVRHHVTVKVVRVVLAATIVVGSVRENGKLSEIAAVRVDAVIRVEPLAVRVAQHLTITSIAGLETFGGGLEVCREAWDGTAGVGTR